MKAFVLLARISIVSSVSSSAVFTMAPAGNALLSGMMPLQTPCTVEESASGCGEFFLLCSCDCIDDSTVRRFAVSCGIHHCCFVGNAQETLEHNNLREEATQPMEQLSMSDPV